MSQKFKILHLTDFHLFRNQEAKLVDLNPFQTLEAVTSKILTNIPQEKPDLIILTGDISQDYSPESYEKALDIVNKFDCPIAATMGNHDDAELFNNNFGDPNKIIIPENTNNWNIIIVNSFWQQHVGGKLGYKDLKFLQEKLDESHNKPVIIFIHHHVLPVESNWIDKINLNNSSQFLSLIDQYKNIKAIVCGHVHQESHIKRNGIDFYSSPSTCWQFATKNPGFKLDTLMPGYRWITLNGDGTIQTKVIRVEQNDDFLPDPNSKGY